MSDAATLLRNRPTLAALAVLTVGLGLGSRALPDVLPSMLGNQPGDALYAVLMYWLVAFVRPALRPVATLAIAVAICFVIELLQLWQLPALVALRSTTLGHLVLGSDFVALDLLAYAIGAGLACVIDVAMAQAFARKGRTDGCA